MLLLMKKKNSKRGIALVVVLALLAMLVIMSVSFVVFMRAERSASRDYAEYVKARSIAQAGVARALIRMQQDLNNTNQFYHGGAFYMTGPGEVCSNWLPDAYAFLDHYVPNYAPFNTALSEARSQGRCRWTNMVTKGISGNNMLVGRYSYMVFDLSDCLDINTISNALSRGYGNYPEEVAMPPDDIQNGANLRAMRQQHRFESLAEVNLRNRTTPQFNTGNEYQPRHLVTFSYSPADTYFTNDAQRGRVYISTNAATIKASVANIRAAANMLGFDTAFADNVADFADRSTDIPTNPNQMGGGKLVPMLYEVVVTNGLRQTTIAGKKVWEYEVRVFGGTWFPYPVTANAQYIVQMSPIPALAALPTATPIIPPAFPWVIVTNGYQAAAAAVPSAILAPLPISTPTNTHGSNSYVIVYRTAYTDAVSSVSASINLPTTYYVRKLSGTTFAGGIVDQAPTVSGNVLIPLPAAIPNKSAPAQGWGVVDPRINHRTTDWRKNAATDYFTLITKTNEFCDTIGATYDKDKDKNGDGSTFIYARRPTDPAGLLNIGDLGYLLYHADKPWHTVRLTTPQNTLKDNSAYIFNMLSVIPTNRVYQGFVNPNSQDSGALLCAFLGASKARYYGEVNSAAVASMDLSQSTKLAQALINKGLKSGAYKQHAYTNIADVCRLTGGYSGSDLYNVLSIPSETTPDLWRQKAVMRNSIGLLNPRQNYWLVLVCAQAVKTINPNATTYTPGTDFVTAEVQCLAYIWRDPYEDPTDTIHPIGQKRHKMFVQFFKWL